MTLGDIYSEVAHYFEKEKPRFFRLILVNLAALHSHALFGQENP